MIVRNASPQDLPHIVELETAPENRSFVGSWPIDVHAHTLSSPDACYLVAEGPASQVLGFAILRGLQSEHKSLELKRIVVAQPNQGIGKMILEAVANKAFNDFGAHRLFLDVFTTNPRAQHVYRSFGFREDGVLREAIFRDGGYHSLLLMSLLDHEYQSR
jgi:diamine N-acetyltransferase